MWQRRHRCVMSHASVLMFRSDRTNVVTKLPLQVAIRQHRFEFYGRAAVKAQFGTVSPRSFAACAGAGSLQIGGHVMNRFLTVGCVAAVLTAIPIAAQAADAERPYYRAPYTGIYNWT